MFIVTFRASKPDYDENSNIHHFNHQLVSVLVGGARDMAIENAKKVLRSRPSCVAFKGPFTHFTLDKVTDEELEKYILPNFHSIELFTGVLTFSALDG